MTLQLGGPSSLSNSVLSISQGWSCVEASQIDHVIRYLQQHHQQHQHHENNQIIVVVVVVVVVVIIIIIIIFIIIIIISSSSSSSISILVNMFLMLISFVEVNASIHQVIMWSTSFPPRQCPSRWWWYYLMMFVWSAHLDIAFTL